MKFKYVICSPLINQWKKREQGIQAISMLWVVKKYTMKRFQILTLLDIFTLCLKLTHP